MMLFRRIKFNKPHNFCIITKFIKIYLFFSVILMTDIENKKSNKTVQNMIIQNTQNHLFNL